MRGITDILPLPGISELEDLVRGLVKRSKDAGYEDSRRILLATRLDDLLACARQLDDFSEIKSELDAIHQQFEAAAQSRSRFKIFKSQRRLAMWDGLDVRIGQVLDTSLLRLATQVQQFQRQNVAYMRENKLPVIQSYEITNQVEIPRRLSKESWEHENAPKNIQLPDLITSCRSGRLGTRFVNYKRFTTRSGASAAESVELELAQLTQMLHPNVAALAGMTQGYTGLDGFIVVANELPIEEFISHSHYSGASFAKCIEGLISYTQAYKHPMAESITVGADGGVVVFPSFDEETCLWACVPYLGAYLSLAAWTRLEPSVKLLIDAFCYNPEYPPTPQLWKLLEDCRNLGPAFNQLQFVEIAAQSGIFPILRNHEEITWAGSQLAPGFTIITGDFGSLTSCGTNVDPEHAWVSFGRSQYFKTQDVTMCFIEDCETDRRLMPMKNEGWLSWNLSSYIQQRLVSINLWVRIPSLIYSCEWGVILSEAQEISQRCGTPLADMHLCDSLSYSISLEIGTPCPALETPSLLFFHRNPHADNPQEFWGYFSSSYDPQCLASQATFKKPNWTSLFKLHISSYCMFNDWSKMYHRLLEEGVATIPCSYQGVSAAEAS